jgi:hypothetical protein
MNIFTIKTVSFDEGERDPFGFDDYSEKLGAEYLPFSGSVSKPSYFLFVSYVNQFIVTNKELSKNAKQKREIQIRLEKLLVYCWKKNGENLRSQSIIGNSYQLDDIDVFTSKNWVTQNAFKIYTDKNFCPQTLEFYNNRIGNNQISILKEFILYDKKQYEDKQNKAFLDKLIKQLQKSSLSLFYHHLLKQSIVKRFKKELSEKIKAKNKDKHWQYLQPFFEYKKFENDNFYKKFLENSNLPFLQLNDWFVKFVNAVDADLNNKVNKNQLWAEADKYFDKIPDHLHSLSKADVVLHKRMKKSKWFQYNDNERRYTYYDNGNKSEKRRLENLWESYKKRQGEEEGARYFFNYRHYALLRLLKDLQS